mmetsp:Transcript_33045/g.29949  ORF Transcript_33045/g.29949 Transcript_33045/m.29949 type:complete len:118 (-) Transcript_33045:854-1207(-)
MNTLSSRKFSKGELQYIWKEITQASDGLSYYDLTNCLNMNKFEKKDTSQLSRSASMGLFKSVDSASSIFSPQYRKEMMAKSLLNGTNFSRGAYANEVFEKLKQSIRASKNNILELCQ